MCGEYYFPALSSIGIDSFNMETAQIEMVEIIL